MLMFSSAEDVRHAVGDATSGSCGRSGAELWRSLGEHGAIAGLYPDDVSAGPDARLLAVLLSELDATCSVGAVLAVCVQVATVIPLLAGTRVISHGVEPGQVLAGLLQGEITVALAVSDGAASGSDLLNSSTSFDWTNGALSATGGKTWITNAVFCHYVLALGRHSTSNHFSSFSLVLVPRAVSGLRVEEAASTLLAEAGLGHIYFDLQELGCYAVIGGKGRGLLRFADHVSTERLAGALWAEALCTRKLASLHSFLVQRRHGTSVLWGNAAVRDRFGRCLLALVQLRALCEAAMRSNGGHISALGSVQLKATAAETVRVVAAECVDLRGADAFRDRGESIEQAELLMFSLAGGATGLMMAQMADHASELLRPAGSFGRP